jgi:glycosyltransferase involved in cell wall biosynthesis
MGLGKPVVVTDVGGCAETVEDRVSGFVVPIKDVKCLADRILMLGLDKNLRLKIGNAARMRAEEVFSIEKNVRKTESIYKEFLGEDAMYM